MKFQGLVFFDYCDSVLVLTAEGCSRSIWDLPKDFFPNNRTPLSYHEDESRWDLRETRTRLRSAARGQEFVINLDIYPEVKKWLEEDLLRLSISNLDRGQGSK
jgi:hypothetical protein